MSKDLESEIQAVCSTMSQQQLAALKEMFGDEELPKTSRYVRKVLTKDKVHECKVVIECTLCGSTLTRVFMSVSSYSSRMSTPTCCMCEDTLNKKSKEELIAIAIKTAEGAFHAVKEAKNAPVEQVRTIDHREEASNLANNEGSSEVLSS